jgi:hypothetical protein
MKSELVELICGELRARLERLAKAAIAAHEAATDPGSKAESKYDTRSLEESYLATGQARQVKELGATLMTFENLRLRDFSENDPVDAGALVTLRKPGGLQTTRFLLAPAAGGLEILHDFEEITLLSPESPLYEKLLGKMIREHVETPDFEIVAIH